MPAARPTPVARPTRPLAVAARRPASALLTALLAALCALGLTAALAVLAAPPAAAHDRLTGSDPADGSQLDAPPAAITLTFNTEPLSVEPQVVVTDSAGTVVVQGSPTIAGPTATLPLDTAATPLGGDSYTVAWRVVSSDGHPIEGTFGFSVADQPAAEPAPAEPEPSTPSADASETSAPAEESGAAAEAGDDATADATPVDAAAEDEGSSALPLVIGIVVAVVVVGGVVTVLVLRRHGTPGAPQGPQD